MRRGIIALIMLAFTLALTSCNSTANNKTEDPKGMKSSVESKQNPNQWSLEAKVSNGKTLEEKADVNLKEDPKSIISTVENKQNTKNGSTGTKVSQEETLKEKAEHLIRNFIIAVNNQDEMVLVDLIKHPSFVSEHIKPALENYYIYFGGSKLKGYRFKGPEPNTPEAYLFEIYAENGKSKNLTASFQENNAKVIDELFYYSFGANYLLRDFTNYLQQKDHIRLADMFSYEGVSYLESSAKEIISNYEKVFDLDKGLKFRFFGLEVYGLKYTVQGYKNYIPVEHEVLINCGDGLVGLKDEFIRYKVN